MSDEDKQNAKPEAEAPAADAKTSAQTVAEAIDAAKKAAEAANEAADVANAATDAANEANEAANNAADAAKEAAGAARKAAEAALDAADGDDAADEAADAATKAAEAARTAAAAARKAARGGLELKRPGFWRRLVARLRGETLEGDEEKPPSKTFKERLDEIRADPKAFAMELLRGFAELTKTVLYALVLAAAIRTLIFQPFWIPTGSMKPTLLIGDFLFVNKYAYGFSAYSCPNYGAWNMCAFWEGSESSQNRIWGTEPERGDVVVFRHPVIKEDYIKRLIGLPGDTVETRDGVLYINGQAAPQDPDGRFVETYAEQGSMGGRPRCINNPRLGEDCVKALAYETLPGGVRHAVLDVGTQRSDDFGPVTVPEDHYFFMGDNRDNSTDSRYSQTIGGVGFVHREFLVGRADRVVFSSAGRSIMYFWTWRSDRYFKAVE